MAAAPTGMLLLSKGSAEDPETRSGSAPEIVAVHGFGGHREESWTHVDKETGEETMWLKDFLPDYVPGSRVTTFGYNLENEGISAAEIKEKAIELLEALSVDRNADEQQSRSLVFIGHNLGGTIIMQALLIASSKSIYSVIAASTSLLLFFGTPHRAPDLSAWERLAYNLLSTTRRRYRGRISKILKGSAQALMEVSEAYYTMAGIYSMINFFEREEVGSLGSLVVNEHSATVDVPGESRVGLARDHFKICQFATAEDEFRLACEKIRNASNPDNDYIECLRTLSTLDWKNYLPSTPLPHPDTLHWINENEAYTSWLSRSESCTLQIHGQSGSGISVLASFLSKVLLTSITDATIVNFSFNAEDDRQSSTHKMFVSLARQLLSHDPSSFTYVRYLYKLIAEELNWKIENVWVFFRSMLTCPRQRQIICIIDGADECNPSRRQYLDDLLALAEPADTNLKIIITGGAARTARPLPHLVINLDTQAGTRADVESIVTGGISSLVQRRPAFLEFKAELLRDLLSPGTTVLAATLMLKRLEVVQIRSTPMSIRKELELLPRNLPEAYKCLLDGIPPESSSWAWKAISWILHAFRPLKVDELSIAMAIERDSGPFSSFEDQIPQDLPRDLRHAFGGLIRIQNDEVLLVHKSAKEFLLKGHDGSCHFVDHAGIAQACLTYLSHIQPPPVAYGGGEPKVRFPPTRHYDLLTYAVQHWPTHYRLAKDKSSVYQSALKFLKDKKLMHMWSELYWCQGNPATRRQLSFNDPLPVAAELGFNDIVGALLEKSPPDDGYRSMALDMAAERGDESLVAQLLESRAVITVALHLAAQNGHLDVVSHLLAAGASVSAQDHTDSIPLHLAARSGYQQVVIKLLQAKSDASAVNMDGSTPLHLAAEFGHVEVVQMLLSAGAGPGIAGKDGSTPLHLATKSGQLEAVKKLLDAKADVDAVDHSGSTPLHLAVASRRAEIVRALLRFKPNLSAIDHNKQTALHLAVLQGHIGVAEQLLDEGADAKAVDAEGSTPLHMAASRGHLDVVRWLLRAKADPRALTNEGCFPLHLAARNGHLQTVEELLEANPNQGEASQDGSTPMHFAAANGHLSVVKVLISVKMSVEAVDSSGSTPLHFAARGGYLEMVRTLLSADALCNATDHTNSTPLHLAAKSGHVEVMRVLLGAGADPEAVDQEQSRPLHLAAQSGQLEAVQCLLEKRVDADGGGENETSPLHVAAKSGYTEIVKVLLRKGVDIEARDDDGCTPLLLAAEEGHLDMVKELLRERANVKAASDAKRTALHFAVERENLDMVIELLEKGANPKSMDSDKRTPLHLAAQAGHAEVVKKLLAAGAESDTIDDQGRTALYIAATGNHTEAVRDLLEAGANGNIANAYQATPLYVATYYEHVSVVQEILKHKVDIDFAGPGGWTALHASFCQPEIAKLLVEAGAVVDVLGKADGTPLWLTTANNELETTRLLLEHKANPLFPNESGSTPLHNTAASAGVEALQLLLDHIDVSPDVRDNSGFTPLRDAVFYGREGAVKLLIDRGDVDVNQKDNEGKWLLQLAIEQGNSDITKMLCDKGIDLTGPGDQVMTLASRLGDTSTIQALLRAGMDPNKTDEHGWTPALLALAHNNKEALDVLLAAPGVIEPSKINPLRPTLWSKTDHSEYLELEEDSLTVKYKADPDSEELPAAAIRSNHPIPPGSSTFYFEIEVVDLGTNGAIGLGLMSGVKPSSLSQMPGWEQGAWGHHGDDGQCFNSSGQGQTYADVWATGDVIGCHINLDNGELFYTRNGESLGIASTDVEGWLFPAVGIQCIDAKIKANFSGPFRCTISELKDPTGRIEPKVVAEPKGEDEPDAVDAPKEDGVKNEPGEGDGAKDGGAQDEPDGFDDSSPE